MPILVPTVQAKRSIRKMRGGSQAHLLETDDAAYVVKFFSNPQGHRILTNEFVSSLLMRALGLLTPEVALVTLPETFEGGPRVPIIHPFSSKAYPTGVHFGSRYPGTPGTHSVYDFFPDEMLPEVANLEHFLGALVFDKWVSNADGRQVIFHRARISSREDQKVDGSVRWTTSMIDNGLAFQGNDWCFRDSPVQGLYARRAVYRDVASLRSFDRWFDALTALKREHLEEIVSLLPPEWIAGEQRELWNMLDCLLARRREVPGLVADSLGLYPRRDKPDVKFFQCGVQIVPLDMCSLGHAY